MTVPCRLTVTALIAPAVAMLPALALLSVPGAASAQSSLPRCGLLPGPGLPADCVLDAPPLTLGFDFTPSAVDPQRGSFTLTQSTPEGGTRDVSGPFDIEAGLFPPAVRDIDSDDVPELLVQTLPDALDLWMLDGDGFFRPAGRLAAGSPALIEERGALVVGTVPAPDGQSTETAYLLDRSAVVLLFRLGIDPATRTCRLLDADTGGTAGLNAEVLIAECAARAWPDTAGEDAEE